MMEARANRGMSDGTRKRLIGARFGRLTVLRRYAGEYLECRCDCGNEKTVQVSNLRSGAIKSCGCQWHVPTPEFREACRRSAVARNARMTADERSAVVQRSWETRNRSAVNGS